MSSLPGHAATLLSGAIFLALLTIPSGAQEPVDVMSFNIRYGTADDGDHSWQNRRDHVASTILDHAPHLLGLQEALRSQLDELRVVLPGYAEIGVGRDDGQTLGEYAAIMVDTARFTIIDHGTFWLSDTPEVPGSMHWGNRITRIATWARLADRRTRDTVRIYNVHFDHESQPSRERAARLLLDRMSSDASVTDRLILVGDFNSGEDNSAFRLLLGDTRVPLIDTFRVMHPNATAVGTFNAFRGDTTGEKIDAILTGPGWKVLAADIDRRRFGALWPSDHFPVWARLAPLN